MALEDKPISWFPIAGSINAAAILFISVPTSGSTFDSKKITTGELGEALLGVFEYTQDLDTDSKKPLEAINEVNEKAMNISDEYDPERLTPYPYGALTIHGNKLYKCTNPSGTSGPWTAADWTATTLAEEIASGGGGGGGSWTDVTGTLAAGSTSITLSHVAITSSSTIDIYTDRFGVNPTAVTISTGSITLTFEAQSAATDVKVRIS